jgi:tetratricopeptide (TPR) repeat protein
MSPSSVPNRIGLAVLVASLIGPFSRSDSAAQAPPAKPTSPSATEKPSPPPKTLTGEDAKRVEALEKTIDQLRRAGKFAEALEPAEQVLAIRARALGPGHYQTADARRTIEILKLIARLPEEGRRAMASIGSLKEEAQASEAQAKYADAAKKRQTVMEISRRWLGEDHPDTAQSYNNLATNLDAQGRHAEALPLYQRALDIGRKAVGEDHPETARAYNNLAANLRAQGRHAEAQPLLQRALDICRKVLGEGHPNTAIGYDNLAWNLDGQGRYAEALPLYRRALDIRRTALGEGHPHTALSYNNLALNLNYQGRHAQALPLYQRALDIQRKVLGEDHPDTAASYSNLAANLRAQGRYAEAQPLHQRALDICRKVLGERHPNTAACYINLAANLNAQGQYAEAQPLYQRALDIRRTALGEGHTDTANSYDNLARNLDAQGRYAEAQTLLQRALDIQRKALGEDHPHTAASYNNLAANLRAQGRYAEALPLLQRALDICRKVLGEGHPNTATCYNNLAVSLREQGRHAEALPLYQRALDIRRTAVGEGHPNTATCYNNLASNLGAQGRYAEAQPLLQRALDIFRKVLGEGHPNTAICYNNLAWNLDGQGRYAEAQPLYQRALDIRRKALGEGHPDTAQGHDNLALNLDAQRRYAEALPLYQRALDIRRKAVGEGHPHTAQSYNNLATNLDEQGRHAEALPLYQRALDIRRTALGEDHPDTAASYNNLATNLDAQGRAQEAIAHWRAAIQSMERSRRALSNSGLERVLATRIDPLSALAIALARHDQGREAWLSWESSLARGLLDDLSVRQLRPLNSEEHRQEADLLGQLQRLDEQIGKLAAQSRRTQDDDRRLEQLRTQEGTLRGRFREFAQALETRYGAFAGKAVALGDIQDALSADAALVGWVDLKSRGTGLSHHWACVVRKHGDPAWVQIPGSGQKGDWTKEDDQPIEALRKALAQNLPAWHGHAAQVVRQRLEPLLFHLEGVQHLIVLPSQDLAGVPIEALLAAGPPELAKRVVSYAPSGTMFARLIRPRPGDSGSPRLLALGDPAYRPPELEPAPPKPPDHGIAILAVEPFGTADLAGIQRDDVLLEYNGKLLKSVADLDVVPAEAGARRIPVKLWRHGEVRALEVSAGQLGINPSREQSAAQTILARREADALLKPLTRGQDWARLPGTRREVEAIAGLFPADQVTTLLGPQATESAVQRLAGSGALKQYRYLHFAAHGRTNPAVAMSSAILLAPDPDRSAGPAAPQTDGQITAEQIVRTWELDAELAVLSACESGLGRSAGGEGYLGFAQALFVKGARSLVLSQWRVDDKATALLMTRFYQNLLGRRADLKVPLSKAEALDEAKRWLRNLTAAEIGSALTALERGPVRPLADGTGTAPPAPKPAGLRPYAHPYYWASFVLVGNPD